MFAIFLIISFAVLIAASHTPEEWSEILNNIKE